MQFGQALAFIGAQPLPRHFDDRDERPVQAIDYRDAEVEVLADVDSIADLLYSECFGHGAVTVGPKQTAQPTDALTVPQLLLLVLTGGDATCLAARALLVEQILQAQQPRVEAKAAALAAERALDEVEDPIAEGRTS